MERLDLNNGRLSGLSSVETLYSYVQKVYLKTYKDEEKIKMLRIVLELKNEITLSPGKVLCLQITDDSDCAFYYSLMLTHEDFAILKSQQGLLVDFDHFPSQLIKLLEICRCQDATNKFILVLDKEDSMMLHSIQQVENTKGYIFLKVIETNNFKNLCHISLKVRQGSDADIKNHMSMKIASLTEKLMEECKKHKISEMNLNEALKALEAKTKELTDLQVKVSEEKNNLKLETSHQISEEREKLTKLQMDWQQRLEMEKSQLVIQNQKQLSEMNEQINLLTFNNKNLYESRCQLETTVKEKTFQIEALEKEVMQLSQETSHLKKVNAQLDLDYHERDKMVMNMKTRLAVVEQELKDKGKFLEKQQELLKAANDQKNFLEEALNEKDVQLQKKQSAVQSLSSDLMKYNDVIAKLQADLAANKAKMKLRTDIALEQEKVLEKQSQQLAAQTKKIEELTAEVAKLTDQLVTLKAELGETKKKLEEKELTIKKNDNVISWLNRRLTEANAPATTTSSNANINLISSNRTDNDESLTASQPKGNVFNLTKAWPPWLVNSVVGSNTSRSDSTGVSNPGSVHFQLSMNSSEGSYQSATQLTSRSDEQNNKEEKMIENRTEKKTRGLDPKYFQTRTDKDFIPNSQILKTNIGAVDNTKMNSTANSAENGKKQISAYFPKKTVAL